MNGLELLVIVKATVCLVLSIYLRKEFDRHGFNLWIFVMSPMFIILVIAFVLWEGSPSAFTEELFLSLAALIMFIALLVTLIAVSRGRR